MSEEVGSVLILKYWPKKFDLWICIHVSVFAERQSREQLRLQASFVNSSVKLIHRVSLNEIEFRQANNIWNVPYKDTSYLPPLWPCKTLPSGEIF